MQKTTAMSVIKYFYIFLTLPIFGYGNIVKNDNHTKIEGQLWTAGVNKRFQNMTNDQLKKYLGAKKPLNVQSTFPKSMLVGAEDLPDTFYAYDKWPQCADIIQNVRDQAACGSCWATASAAGMSDLTCIKYNGHPSPYLSEEDLLSCCEAPSLNYEGTSCGDCAGGYVQKAFQYWYTDGVVTGGPYDSGLGCQPYTVPPAIRATPDIPQCDGICSNPFYSTSYNRDKQRGKWFNIAKGVQEMKSAIYNYGPIVILHFDVYTDFQTSYKGGIYHRTSGSGYQGGHTSKVIGWGSDDGEPYWLVVNSWGTDWGINGFFKMRLGTNECGFENGAVYGEALGYDQPITTTPSSAMKLRISLAWFSLIALIKMLVW